MNVNDIKGRLKQWGEDGYIDADLRSGVNEALATIKELEGKLLKLLFQAHCWRISTWPVPTVSW